MLMEDPWANAWRDSSKSALPEPSPLWASPSVSVLHGDNEDDLATPSWPRDAAPAWGAPDLSADHIWGTTEASSSSAWNPRPSTFDEISLARESSQTETPEAASDDSSSLSLHEEETWTKSQIQEVETRTTFAFFPETVSIPSETLEAINGSKPGSEVEHCSSSPQTPPSPISQLPNPISAPLSDDIDGFGSFETGQGSQEKGTWTPSDLPTSSTDPANWDSAWQVEYEDGKNEQEDAWEAAKRQKEKQDRHVPPELLSSILRQLEELTKDIWGDLNTADAKINDDQDFEKLGLSPVLQRLSPDDMTLSPIVPFAKTFTVKHMSASLKLTRHFSSTRSSPMAMYLASKGSNSWEAAVKARSTLASDDVTPIGWKIVDSSNSPPEESPVDDGKKKANSIFSFFGRKSHNLSVDASLKRSASPLTTSTATHSRTSTPRAGSPATESTERPKNVEPEPSTITNKSSSTIPTTEASQPSAVSRFLGRIVGHSKTQSIDSLALSADDLEFLADVPTSSNISFKNDDLKMMLETPLSFSPPPFAPSSRRESPLPKLPPPPSRSIRSGGSEDLLSLFDPTALSTLPENPLTVKLPPSGATPSDETATHISHPNRLRMTFEEPPIKATPSRSSMDTVDLLESRPPINLIRTSTIGSVAKSDVLQLPKSSIPAPILLAPPISPPKALSLESVQVDDDDDFSDFLSSPAVKNSQLNSFSPDSLNNSSVFVPSIRMADTHDDFGDFEGVINNFPGPTPPLSSTRAPAAGSTSAQSKIVPTRKASKRADHSRTLSLLETAATRGHWLSPPSPIPEALSPPPASGSATVGPYGPKSNLQTQQALATAASLALNPPTALAAGIGASAWLIPPPQSGTLLKPSVISSAPSPARLTPPSRPEFQSSRSSNSAQLGGLSAQDLSFFEGL